MTNFEYTITFLIIYLVILIIYKIIFWLCDRSSDDKEANNKKQDKIKTIEVDGFGIVDSEEEGNANKKSSENITTYIIKDKRKTSKINYNSDENLGNYMQDVLVLEKPIPENIRLNLQSEGVEETKQNNIKNEEMVDDYNGFALDDSFQENISRSSLNSDNQMNGIFENIVNEEPNSNSNQLVSEYKGLSKEMRMFLIAKILDKKISM